MGVEWGEWAGEVVGDDVGVGAEGGCVGVWRGGEGVDDGVAGR